MSENNHVESNKETCPYCKKEIEDQFFDDHMMCHELEMEEKANNDNINQQRNDNNNTNNNRNNRTNNRTNDTNNNSNNNENFLSQILGMFNTSSQQNNSSNNNNRNNRDQNRSNNSSSSNRNNNNSNPFGLFSDLLGCVVNNINNNNNNRENGNNNNRNNSSNNNNDNNQETISQIGNLFSTLSKTVSNISQLTSQLTEITDQFNPDINDNAPPPIPGNNSNNNIPFPSNFMIPPNFQNIIPQVIIGHGGSIFNQVPINIDAVMSLLPSSTVTEKKEDGNNNCIICLSDFEIGDKVTSLPCLHMFHTDCIKDWLKTKNHCPVCKYTITEESLRRGN